MVIFNSYVKLPEVQQGPAPPVPLLQLADLRIEIALLRLGFWFPWSTTRDGEPWRLHISDLNHPQDPPWGSLGVVKLPVLSISAMISAG